eukprot:scaffold5946_cov114-Isochrysis_galbana.AAC.2
MAAGGGRSSVVLILSPRIRMQLVRAQTGWWDSAPAVPKPLEVQGQHRRRRLHQYCLRGVDEGRTLGARVLIFTL